MKLSPSQRQLAVSALRVAVDVWKEDAENTSVSRLREQFQRQVSDGEQLARELEEAADDGE